MAHSKFAHLPRRGQRVLRALGTASNVHWPLGPTGAVRPPRALACPLVREGMTPRGESQFLWRRVSTWVLPDWPLVSAEQSVLWMSPAAPASCRGAARPPRAPCPPRVSSAAPSWRRTVVFPPSRAGLPSWTVRGLLSDDGAADGPLSGEG